MNKTLEASFTFTGTIIGAGVLGLPYIIEKSGFLIGLIDIVLIGFLVLLVSLMLGEVSLRIKKPHQLPGLTEKYLGKKPKHLVAFLSIGSIYGALIAYTQGGGDIISLLGIPPILSKLLFFIPFAAITYFGIKGVEEGEDIFTSLIIIFILVISIASLFYFNPTNIAKIELINFFTPMGVIVFAFAGVFAIPQMKEILWYERKKLKKSILLGFSIPFFLYVFFVFSCIGALGGEVSEVATIALGEHYGIFFSIFGNLFALFAMATGFIALGNALIEIYNQDYKISKNLSFIAAMFPPLLALAGLSTFTEILSLTGALFIIPLYILIVYIFYKIKRLGERKPEYELKLPNWSFWVIALFFLFVAVLVSWQSLFIGI